MPAGGGGGTAREESTQAGELDAAAKRQGYG